MTKNSKTNSMRTQPRQLSETERTLLLSKRLLRLGEAARLLAVSPRTIRRWMDDEKLPSVRTAGNQRRVRVESLKPYL